MKILAIGDVTTPAGIEYLGEKLWKIREQYGIDFCIVNGENASFITGISAPLADKLIKSGADCITGGNHTLYNKMAYTYLDDTKEILRPINFGDRAPGRGYTILDAMGYRILVINAMGQVHVEPQLDSPYPYVDKALKECYGKYDIAVLDIHAEATGEKLAIAYNYDGKIQVIFGTHTHVPTADTSILQGGTGYVTDLGMCGNTGGILGMEPEGVIEKMKTRLPRKFEAAHGEIKCDGVIFTVDMKTKRTITVERIKF